MDVATIEMDKAKAQEALKEYRAVLPERGTEADREIMAGCAQLAKGHTLINVREAIAKAGMDHQARPRLAIARADGDRVSCDRWSPSDGKFPVAFHTLFAHDYAWGHAGGCGFGHSKRCSGRIDFTDYPKPDSLNTLVAPVPHIPAPLRPAANLRRFHILWEPETWEEVARDPILLRRVGGNLYAVLAQWELTELERSVLSGRG